MVDPFNNLLADVPVVILAGGRGSRFDHESQVLPKPMIEVAGKPILQHIIDNFVAQGSRDFVIAGGYLVSKIDEYFKSDKQGPLAFGWDDRISWKRYGIEYPDCGVKVTVVDTGQDSHTGERLGRLYEAGLLERPYLLTYGDGLSDVSVRDVVLHHRWYSDPNNREKRFSPPLVTMTAVNPPGRFGVVNFFDGMPDGLVQAFGEKPPAMDWINGGFMYVEPGFVPEYIVNVPEGCPPDPSGYNELERFALKWLSHEKRLLARRHCGYWRCMDTRRDLEQIESDVKLANDLLPWRRDMMWTE